MRILPRGAIAKISQTLAASNKELARALPDSKGGEVPKQQQWARTQINTYFTIANGETELLYSAENWVRIKLKLETAGPVAIGTDQNIQPVLSGRGQLLDTGELFETYLPKGTRVYVISETVNRVAVTIEPIPWLEQISMQIAEGFAALGSATSRASEVVSSAVTALRGIWTPTAPSGTQPSQLPIPKPGLVSRPRLTRLPTPKRMP